MTADAAIWIQAGATVMLLGITAWYAWLTRSISKSAVASAKAAEGSAALAARSLQLQSVPILDYHLEARIPRVRNIGSGIAFAVTVDIEGVVTFGPHGMLAPGESWKPPKTRAVSPSESGYRVEITYYDVLNVPYRVQKSFFLRGETVTESAHKLAPDGEWLPLQWQESDPG